MNKHLIVSGIAVLLICVGLSGCMSEYEVEKSPRELIIGTWIRENGDERIFYGNGTCRFKFLEVNIFDEEYYITQTLSYEMVTKENIIYFLNEGYGEEIGDVSFTNGYEFKDENTIIFTFESPLIPYEVNEYIRIR